MKRLVKRLALTLLMVLALMALCPIAVLVLRVVQPPKLTIQPPLAQEIK